MKFFIKIKNKVVNMYNGEIYSITILGLAALLSGLITWMSSIYGGMQSELLLEYNNLSSQSYNEHLGGALYYYQDLELQKNVDNLVIAYGVAELAGDETRMFETSFQLVRSMSSFYGENYAKEVMYWDVEDYLNSTDSGDRQDIYDYINDWIARYSERKSLSRGTSRQDSVISRYIDVEETYFKESNRLKEEAIKKYDLSHIYGSYCDRYNIVLMLYSLVLFLMGIVTSVEEKKGVNGLKLISTLIIIFASIYALSVPLPIFI